MFQLDRITLTAITQHSARAEGKSSEKLTEATVNKLSSCNIRHWFQWKKLIVYIKKIILLLLFIYFDNRGTFHGQALRTLHGDPNLRVLATLQQPASGKFRVSSRKYYVQLFTPYLSGALNMEYGIKFLLNYEVQLHFSIWWWMKWG